MLLLENEFKRGDLLAVLIKRSLVFLSMMEPGKDSAAGFGSLETLKRYFSDAPGAQRLV